MSFTNNNFDMRDPLVKLVMSFLSEQSGIPDDSDMETGEVEQQPTAAEFKKGTQPENELTDTIQINPDMSSTTQSPDSQDNSYTYNAQQ